MDFHTMVTRFRERAENEQDLTELGPRDRKYIEDYEEDGPKQPRPMYPFESLFGKKMRIAIPLGGKAKKDGTRMFKHMVEQGWEPAFTKKTVKQKKTRNDGSRYTVDQEIPELTMVKSVTKVIPKGPRAGEEVTQKTRISMGKLVNKIGRPEDKEWWNKYQNKLRVMEHVREYFLRPWLNDFANVDRDPPMIIVTRKPIDVARMSDFEPKWESCHSPSRSYFYSALREAEGHGAVAYLVRPEDYEKIKGNLQQEEIFSDKDTPNAPGERIEPVGRLRIRRLINVYENGIEFALPEDSVYGLAPADFILTVQEWARESQKHMWADQDGRLSVDRFKPDQWKTVGGSYWDTPPRELLGQLWSNDDRDQEARNKLQLLGPLHGEEHEAYGEEEDWNISYRREQELELSRLETAPKEGGTYLAPYREKLQQLTLQFNNKAKHIQVLNIDIEPLQVQETYGINFSALMELYFIYPMPSIPQEDLPRHIDNNDGPEPLSWFTNTKAELAELLRGTGVLATSYPAGNYNGDYAQIRSGAARQADWYWRIIGDKLSLFQQRQVGLDIQNGQGEMFIQAQNPHIGGMPPMRHLVFSEEDLEELTESYEEALQALLEDDSSYEAAHSKVYSYLVEKGFFGQSGEGEQETMLKESDETRLFQISLKLQVKPGVGGGIEAKLNRIRAIAGVTVVGHEEGLNVGKHTFVVAKVKFHPPQDSLRPISYVWETLVPQINSSHSVPGIKVIEIINGTLKRLDKR